MARYDYRCTACGEVFEVERDDRARGELPGVRSEGREGLHRERHQVRRKRLLQHRSARRELLDGSDLWIERQQRIYRFRRFCRLVAFLRELPAQRRVGAPTQYDLLPALAHAFVGQRLFCNQTGQRARERARCPLHAKIAHVHPASARMHGNARSPAQPRRNLHALPRQGGFNF